MPNLGYPSLDPRQIQDKILAQGKITGNEWVEIELEQADDIYHVLMCVRERSSSEFAPYVQYSEDGGSTYTLLRGFDMGEAVTIVLPKGITNILIYGNDTTSPLFYVLVRKKGYV